MPSKILLQYQDSFDVLIMLQYTLKLFHEGIAILVREEIKMYY